MNKKIKYLSICFFSIVGCLSLSECRYIYSIEKDNKETSTNFKEYISNKSNENKSSNFKEDKEKNSLVYEEIKKQEEERIKKQKEEEERIKKEQEEKEKQEQLKKEEEEKVKNEQQTQNTVQTETQTQTSNQSFSFIGDVVLEGDISLSVKQAMNNKMKMIPPNLLNRFYNNGYTLVLTTKSIQGNYYNGSVAGVISGLFVGDDKTIYVAATEKYVDMALLHEFGHFLDSLYGFVSLSDEFKQIYYEEKDYITVFAYDDHYKSNPQEYFASAFEQMMKNPERCKSEVPKTYEFVSRYMI